MAVCPAVLFLSLLLENDNLIGAVGFENRGLDFALGRGCAGLDVSAILDHQHVAQLDLRGLLRLQASPGEWSGPA
jgi:hypothetical protein